MAIQRNVDHIGGNDLIKPEIKLIQGIGGTSAKELGGKPGQFFNTMTNDIYSNFECIIVDFNIQRCYWGRDTIGDEPPLCTSMDANSYESSDGKNCHQCEFLLDNASQVQAKERRNKCTKQPSFMGLLLPNLEPFQFRASGVSASAVLALISRFKYNRACRNPQNPAMIDYHRFKVAVSSQTIKTPNGETYAIRIGDMTPLNDPTMETELYIASAQILGQADNLLLENNDLSQITSFLDQVDKEQLPAPPPIETPVVKNVSPPKVKTEPIPSKPSKISTDDI